MITEEAALARILAKVGALGAEKVVLAEALDRFAARDILATLPLPVFDNSAMDGYAVVASACRKGESQRVIAEQPAGIDRGLRVAPGEAIRIFTGAPIPAGADAVVMQEDVLPRGEEIFLNTEVEPGEFIRRRGCDLSEGQKIVSGGDRIRPQTLALLASQGFAEIDVGKVPRVAILTTGDELMPLGTTQIAPGQIFESNSTLLRALFKKCGVSVVSSEHSPDEPGAIDAALRRGMDHDVLVIVGGMSVGAHDLVKSGLTEAGAETDLWRVAIKPGKPFLFGRKGNCAIFGLPGNPVSAFVTFLLFVRPAILKMMGAGEDELSLRRVEAKLSEESRNPGDRPHYIRGFLARGEFAPIGRQESHALYGMSRANALLRAAPGENLAAGQPVDVLLLD